MYFSNPSDTTTMWYKVSFFIYLSGVKWFWIQCFHSSLTKAKEPILVYYLSIVECRNFVKELVILFHRISAAPWGHEASIIKKSSTGDSSSIFHSHRC